MKLDKVQLGEFIHARHVDLLGARQPWEPYWQEQADYFMPRSRNITSLQFQPTADRDAVLFDATGVNANMTLANGSMDSMTPYASRWFSYDPPPMFIGNDVIEQWYKKCTEIIALEKARSNFYQIMHEVHLDRGGFGTALMYCEEGKRSLFNYRKFDIGTYAVAEDDEGYVDTMSHEFELTARQARQKFGEENLSAEINKAFDDDMGKKREKRFVFIHQCFPRGTDEIEFDKKDGENKPIASVYIEKKGKHVVRISGYDEQPFYCTRYLKWLSNHAYGWCPATIALPDARQLNFLQKQMDSLAEVTAFPRYLVPDTHKDEIDLRAGGATMFDAGQPGSVPREWLTGGKYDVGKDRVEQKQEAINRAFHVDLFRMFADLDKQMTAREVIERSSEKTVQISPTYPKLAAELLTPDLQRNFAMAYRARLLPPPPEEVMMIGVPIPEVTYSSRIALAMKSLENASLAHVIELHTPLIQIKPETMDNLDSDQTFRDSCRNAGLPARWIVDEKTVEDMRAARQEEMEKMQQQAQLGQMAEAAGKVGSVKEDSLVGKALTGALNGNRR